MPSTLDDKAPARCPSVARTRHLQEGAFHGFAVRAKCKHMLSATL